MSNRLATQNLTIAAASVAAVAATYCLATAVSKYGVSGFLRLIWEGDHLSPDVREAVDALDDLESKSIPKEERRLERVEVAIETARLNSVDGPSTVPAAGNEAAADLENIFERYPEIKKDLSMLSFRLDTVAADVDSVKSCGYPEVKRRKKHLSNILVKMMERTDALISSCGGGIK